MTSRYIVISAFLTVSSIGILLWAYSRKNPEKLMPTHLLLDYLLQSRANRVGMVLFWWWLGWHYLAIRQ